MTEESRSGSSRLSRFLSTLGRQEPVEPELEDVLQGKLGEPFTKENFYGHLKQQYAEESIEFYDRVVELKAKIEILQREPVKSAETEAEVLELQAEIVENYVSEEADFPININGTTRNLTLVAAQGTSETKQFQADIFDDAVKEVKKLMAGDPFFNFVKKSKNENLDKGFASFRLKRGIIGIIITMMLSAALILCGAFLEIKLLTNPFLRFVLLPFYFFNFFDIFSGRNRHCPGVCMAGKYMKACPIKQSNGKSKVTYKKVKMDRRIWLLHRTKTMLLMMKIMMSALMMTGIIVAIPPSDFYGDLNLLQK